MASKTTRRELREQIFLLLFEKTFNDDISLEKVIENAGETRELKSVKDLESKTSDIIAHQDEIDARFSKYLRNWTIARISRVALCALRIATYEMIYENDIPASVSINEAVEITKNYSTQEDASFVNGVLGSLFKEFDEIISEN